MKAQFIKADGSIREVTPKNGTDFNLDELKGFVGGWIEIVSSANRGMIIVCNEEGLLRKLPLNQEASRLAGQPIVGDVLYCETDMVR